MSTSSSHGVKWDALCIQVKARDKGVCQYNYGGCTYDKDLTVDHILARINGGQDVETNLVTACRSCNSKKGSKVLTRAAWTNKRWFTKKDKIEDIGGFGE